MPRKQRDYAAEYAAAKRRATAKGYKSEREYKAVSKATGGKAPDRRALSEEFIADAKKERSAISKLRKEAREWSTKRSHVDTSRYSSRMTDAQARAYHDAFVNRPEGDRRSKKYKAEKLRRMRKYLVPQLMTGAEFDERYKG